MAMIDDEDAVRLKNVPVKLAEAIHWFVGKSKREKKKRSGGGVGVGDNDKAPGFAVG